MKEARYLVDTGVFVQAYRAYYSFRVCPGFWDGLIAFHKQGRVLSIDRVFDEVCDYGVEDELSNWVKSAVPSTFFANSTAPEVVNWYGRIQVWANQHPQFSPAAKAEIADGADAWLIAYAGAYDYTVVTSEVFKPDVKARIPIPNVCKAKEFMVPCLDVFQMLEGLGVRFVNQQ